MFRKLLKALIGLAVFAYVGAASYMGVFQRSFLYKTMPEVPVLADAKLPGAEAATLVSGDRIRLNAWVVPPREAGRAVFLYFHGNAGNLMRRAERFRLMTEDGSGLYAIHYRGYGGSDGAPDEDGLHRDAVAAYGEVQRKFPQSKVILFGESLGSGVAVKLASIRPAAALVLDSPYVSVLDRAEATYPWLPVSLLLADTFRSDSWIRSVRMPLLVLHGEKDRIIPFADGQRLFALANEPKTFIGFPEAGHIGGFRYGAMEHIRTFLKEKAGIGNPAS